VKRLSKLLLHTFSVADLFLMAIVLLSAGLVSGQAIFTEFSGTAPAGVIQNYGTILCPGGKEAGPFPPNPPCTPGSRVHVRGLVVQHDTTKATDPRVAGTMVVVFNANTDGWTKNAPGSGSLWGTARLEVGVWREIEGGGKTFVPTGEVWEGTWTGKRKVTSDLALSTLNFVMNGSGGRIQGLESRWEITSPHTGQSTFAGHIIELGSK
jgi:hypothetical protein